MDSRRFEELSRRFARAGTRRDALAGLAAGLAAAAFGLPRHDAAAGGIPIVRCKIPGQKCQHDRTCCSLQCKGGLCTCRKRGKDCWQPLEGSLCCSGRCHNGRCD
jgi:hypothetical protein